MSNDTNADRALYWNAFLARLWAAGLPAIQFGITDNEPILCAVNEKLRELLPGLADDQVAADWMDSHREELLERQVRHEMFTGLAQAAGRVRPPART